MRQAFQKFACCETFTLSEHTCASRYKILLSHFLFFQVMILTALWSQPTLTPVSWKNISAKKTTAQICENITHTFTPIFSLSERYLDSVLYHPKLLLTWWCAYRMTKLLAGLHLLSLFLPPVVSQKSTVPQDPSTLHLRVGHPLQGG